MDAITDLLSRILSALRAPRSPWMDVVEAARYAHMGKDRMRALVNTGEIPSHKAPQSTNGRLVHARDVDAYLMGLPSGAKVPDGLR